MPHKVFGHSIADRAVQEQRIGTAIWRQALDNLYKSNNPRPILGENAERLDGSTGATLADTAPGAEIRFVTHRSSRSGLSCSRLTRRFRCWSFWTRRLRKTPAFPGLDRAGHKRAAQIRADDGNRNVDDRGRQNARTEMIARIFAETGVSRMFKLILGLVSKHQPKERVIRLRNEWVEMDPRGWPEMDVTISVGLGIGDKAEQLAQSDAVLQTMAELGQTPFASLIDANKVYNAVKRKFTAAGIKNTDEYLNEPQEGEQQQQQPSPEEQKAMADMQMQQAKMQTDQELQAMKLQSQREEAALKQELERQKAQFQAQMAEQKFAFEMEMAERKFAFEQQMATRRQSASGKPVKPEPAGRGPRQVGRNQL